MTANISQIASGIQKGYDTCILDKDTKLSDVEVSLDVSTTAIIINIINGPEQLTRARG